MDVSLKGSASLCVATAGDSTIINKGRTREFTNEIIVVEKQVSCRIKNNKQA
jgi:hypothetical protein